MRNVLLGTCLLALSGCIDWPELDLPEVPLDETFPNLGVTDDLQAPTITEDSLDATETLDARAAALRRRAGILDQSIDTDQGLDGIRSDLADTGG